MAKYCDDIFGDLLLKEPLPDYQVSSVEEGALKKPFHSLNVVEAGARSCISITKSTQEKNPDQK